MSAAYPQPADGIARLRAHLQAMPPVAALQIDTIAMDGDTLRLVAPLAVHVNDKGCAFGGSLVSLMTLAGWGLVTLQLEAAGLDCDVFVADSEVKYRAPLYDDLVVQARAAEGMDWTAFIAAVRAAGRADIRVCAAARTAEGRDATRSASRYVAIVRGQAG